MPPIVDEILVVDNASTDRTAEVARVARRARRARRPQGLRPRLQDRLREGARRHHRHHGRRRDVSAELDRAARPRAGRGEGRLHDGAPVALEERQVEERDPARRQRRPLDGDDGRSSSSSSSTRSPACGSSAARPCPASSRPATRMALSQEIKILAFTNPKIRCLEMPIYYGERIGESKLNIWRTASATSSSSSSCG